MATIRENKAETSQQSDRASSSSDEKASGHHGSKSIFSKLGDLPQWKVGGKLLSGPSLNWGIGIIASCGFLVSRLGVRAPPVVALANLYYSMSSCHESTPSELLA
jgi:hypothetical protein